MIPYSLNRGRGGFNLYVKKVIVRPYEEHSGSFSIIKVLRKAVYINLYAFNTIISFILSAMLAIPVFIFIESHNYFDITNKKTSLKVNVIKKYENTQTPRKQPVKRREEKPKPPEKNEAPKKNKVQKKKANRPKQAKTKSKSKPKSLDLKMPDKVSSTLNSQLNKFKKNKKRKSSGQDNKSFTPLLDQSVNTTVIGSNPSYENAPKLEARGIQAYDQEAENNEEFFTDEELQSNESFEDFESEFEPEKDEITVSSETANKLDLLIIKGIVNDPSGRINSIKRKIINKLKKASLEHGEYCYESDIYLLKLKYFGQIILELSPREVPFRVISNFERNIPERLSLCNID